MFVSKLIEKNDYYSLYVNAIVISMFIGSFYGLVVLAQQIHPILIVIPALIFVLGLVYLKKIARLLEQISSRRVIEMGPDKISIKTKKGLLEEEFMIGDLDKIQMKREYTLNWQTIKSIWSSARGKHDKNFITIYQKDQSTNFEFLIESFYMVEELKKIAEHWGQEGLEIEYID